MAEGIADMKAEIDQPRYSLIEYRVGNHQKQNVYRGDQYIGVMFSPIDAAAVVNALNAGVGECTCHTYEICVGECCGVGMCSCTWNQESDT